MYSREELLSIGHHNQNRVLVDLGCGARKKEKFIGVDTVALPSVDIVWDIKEGLPFTDNSIDQIYSQFLFEHIKNTIFLFQELYRVCRNGAKIEFRVPYYQSVTQYKDPTHKAIIPSEMMRYFSDDKWYGSDYGINTNFRLLRIKYIYLPPFNALASKWLFFLWPISYPIIIFARRFLWNVVHSITMEVEVIKS